MRTEIAKVAKKISAVKKNSPRILATFTSGLAYRKKKDETNVPILKPELTRESTLVD